MKNFVMCNQYTINKIQRRVKKWQWQGWRNNRRNYSPGNSSRWLCADKFEKNSAFYRIFSSGNRGCFVCFSFPFFKDFRAMLLIVRIACCRSWRNYSDIFKKRSFGTWRYDWFFRISGQYANNLHAIRLD